MNRNDIVQTLQQNPEQARQAQAQLQGIMSRSATDMDFRQKLVNDPRAAIQEFTGSEVPASINFRFIENKADATFVLPQVVDHEAELSEGELESVAGGIAFTVYLVATAVIAFAQGYDSES